jgi:hypothetical protein
LAVAKPVNFKDKLYSASYGVKEDDEEKTERVFVK